jgi:hypothetical protein
LDKAELLDPGKRLRCTFYFLQVLAEMSPDCVVLTVYCSKTRKSTFDLKLVTDGISYFITRRVIPLRYEKLHYVMLSTRPVLDFVIPTTLKALEKVGGQKPNTVVVHSDHSVDAVQEALRDHGFSLEGLPKVPLGGLYTFGCFRRWVEDRIRVGARLYGHPSSSNLISMGDGSDAKPAAARMMAAAGSSSALAAALDDDPEEAAARKRREVYAGYARRKRARKRIEAKVLQSEVARLEKQRDALERVGHDLEARLDRARRVVGAHHEDESDKQQQQQVLKNGIERAAGMRLTAAAAAAAARNDPLLGMQTHPPQLSRSGSNGSGGLGMQHPLSAMSSSSGLPGWYTAPSPYHQQGYHSSYPQGQLYAQGLAGPRPIIFLDAATAAACNPIYVVGDPASFMANHGSSSNGRSGGGGGLMGNVSWSHVPLPSRAPLSNSSSSSFGGAGAAAYPPPPPPPPSPSQPPSLLLLDRRNDTVGVGGDPPHLHVPQR